MMETYRVSFFSNARRPDGRSLRYLHGQIDVAAAAPSGALQVAERKLGNTPIEIASFEVTALTRRPSRARANLAAH